MEGGERMCASSTPLSLKSFTSLIGQMFSLRSTAIKFLRALTDCEAHGISYSLLVFPDTVRLDYFPCT
jgi:hypothetical protein